MSAKGHSKLDSIERRLFSGKNEKKSREHTMYNNVRDVPIWLIVNPLKHN